MTWTLTGVRQRVAFVLLGLAFVHVPLLAFSFWFNQGGGLLPVFAAFLLAATALLLYARFGVAIITQLVIALVLIGQVSMLVFSFAGHPGNRTCTCITSRFWRCSQASATGARS